MNILGIFVKHPIPGQVKTRLAAELGAAFATELYAAFIADLVERFRGRVDRSLLCYAPDEPAAADYFRSIADTDFELWRQPALSFGERLAAFFDEHLSTDDNSTDDNSHGDCRVVVIGSDSPSLPIEYVERAFEDLADHDCVLGPATDGGYYLVGQRNPARAIFDGIEWSTSRVLEQTVARINRVEATLSVLPPWYDVDTSADVELLDGHLRALRQSETRANLPNTTALLSKHFMGDGSRL